MEHTLSFLNRTAVSLDMKNPRNRTLFLPTCSSLFLCILLIPALTRAENNVVEQASKAGIKKCLPAVTTISNFLIGNDKHGAHDAWASKDTDQQIYSSTIERVTPGGTRLISLSVAPVTGGNCSVVYDQIEWFDTSCLVVAKEHYPNHIYKGVLASKVAILEGPATIFLYPAGPGCLSLKKEVIINANALNKGGNKK